MLFCTMQILPLKTIFVFTLIINLRTFQIWPRKRSINCRPRPRYCNLADPHFIIGRIRVICKSHNTNVWIFKAILLKWLPSSKELGKSLKIKYLTQTYKRVSHMTWTLYQCNNLYLLFFHKTFINSWIH